MHLSILRILPVHRRLRPAFGALLALLLAGTWACESSGPGDDDTRPEDELNILTLAQTAPPLATTSVSFWASYDDDTRGEIDFQNADRYLRFEVDKFSLLAFPDGTLFGPGDSVFITVTVVDPARLLFEFEPAGLKFNPLRPAELKLEYGHAGDDVEQDWDDDGTSGDSDDDEIESQFSIWRQASLGLPFLRLGSLKLEEQNEIEAELLSFSRYALAY
jgi:hypothetical protein